MVDGIGISDKSDAAAQQPSWQVRSPSSTSIATNSSA